MLVSDHDVSPLRLIRDARFIEAGRREIAPRRGRHNRLGFAYQVAFISFGMASPTWSSFQIRSESERQGYTDKMSQELIGIIGATIVALALAAIHVP